MNIIGRSLFINGEITSDEDIIIEGSVCGHVIVRNATLSLGPHARIEGNVRGPRVVIAGRLRGGVSAAERIELRASAIVDGSLSANRVVIADGAQFNGGIDMAQRTIAARVARFKAAAG